VRETLTALLAWRLSQNHWAQFSLPNSTLCFRNRLLKLGIELDLCTYRQSALQSLFITDINGLCISIRSPLSLPCWRLTRVSAVDSGYVSMRLCHPLLPIYSSVTNQDDIRLTEIVYS
jgi:hypothetical protein